MLIDLTSGGSLTYVLAPSAMPAAVSIGDATGALIARLEAASGMTVVATVATGAAARARAIELACEATGRSSILACRGTAVAPGTRVVSHGDTLQTIRAIGDDRPAAFVVEVIQASHNACVPPPHYFERVRERCDEAKVLLVSDETTLGLARTGALFAHEREKIEVDLIALSLAVAPGVTGGCVLARRSLGIAAQVGALEAAPAALATLERIERDRLTQHVKQLGKKLQARLNALVESRRQWAMDERGRGLVRSISLWDDAGLVIEGARARGLAVGRTGARGLLIAPPIDTTPAALDEALTVLDEVLAGLSR